MPIQHKFYQTNFGNGFETHSAILDVTPYKPEVMFVGTFNPDTPNANFADFYYGRNYFWPAFKNLFIHKNIVLLNTRMPTNGAPKLPLNPKLEEIFELCEKCKLTFADLISEVLNHENPKYEFLKNDNVIYNMEEYNLINDDKKKDKTEKYINGLSDLHGYGQVNWNTQSIINYLCDNPQIKTIYLTRQRKGVWRREWEKIVKHECMKGRTLTNIYSPSGQRLAGSPRMGSLLHHWLYNANPNFGKLDNVWLQNNGVTLLNFFNKLK